MFRNHHGYYYTTYPVTDLWMFWRYISSIRDHEVWIKVQTIETKVDRDNISIATSIDFIIKYHYKINATSLVLSVGESRWKTMNDFANHVLKTRPIGSRLEWVGTTALGQHYQKIPKTKHKPGFRKYPVRWNDTYGMRRGRQPCSWRSWSVAYYTVDCGQR